MTNRQYDILVSNIKKLQELLEIQSESLTSLAENVKKLNAKTLVVSDIDNELTELKKDIDSLKDEQEA